MTEQPTIEEITNLYKNLSFFSDQPRFNAYINQVLSLIIEKLDKLEVGKEKVKEEDKEFLKLPELPDGKN